MVTSHPDQPAAAAASTLYELQSTLIMFAVLGILFFILHTAWRITQAVMESFQQFTQSKHIYLSRNHASIVLTFRDRETMVDIAQEYIYNAIQSFQKSGKMTVEKVVEKRQVKGRWRMHRLSSEQSIIRKETK